MIYKQLGNVCRRIEFQLPKCLLGSAYGSFTTLRSLQHKGNYWCRHLPDYVTALFSKILDREIEKLVLLATGVDLASDSGTTVFTKERCRLPVCIKG